jgi:hypothetical protein
MPNVIAVEALIPSKLADNRVVTTKRPLKQLTTWKKTYRRLRVSMALPELGKLKFQIHFHTWCRPKNY